MSSQGDLLFFDIHACLMLLQGQQRFSLVLEGICSAFLCTCLLGQTCIAPVPHTQDPPALLARDKHVAPGRDWDLYLLRVQAQST